MAITVDFVHIVNSLFDLELEQLDFELNIKDLLEIVSVSHDVVGLLVSEFLSLYCSLELHNSVLHVAQVVSLKFILFFCCGIISVQCVDHICQLDSTVYSILISQFLLHVRNLLVCNCLT